VKFAIYYFYAGHLLSTERFMGKFANFDDYLPYFYSSRFAIIGAVDSVEKLAK